MLCKISAKSDEMPKNQSKMLEINLPKVGNTLI